MIETKKKKKKKKKRGEEIWKFIKIILALGPIDGMIMMILISYHKRASLIFDSFYTFSTNCKFLSKVLIKCVFNRFYLIIFTFYEVVCSIAEAFDSEYLNRRSQPCHILNLPRKSSTAASTASSDLEAWISFQAVV